MALLELYTSNEVPIYSFTTTLDEKVLTFEICYNTKSAYWSLTILDVNNNTLISGLAIRLGCDLLQQFKHIENLPKGVLFAVNLAGNSEITFDNWGVDVFLMYNEA